MDINVTLKRCVKEKNHSYTPVWSISTLILN